MLYAGRRKIQFSHSAGRLSKHVALANNLSSK